MSYPCFNCFFNIIDNNNINNNNNIMKSKLYNITIDKIYGRTKKNIIFFVKKII